MTTANITQFEIQRYVDRNQVGHDKAFQLLNRIKINRDDLGSGVVLGDVIQNINDRAVMIGFLAMLEEFMNEAVDAVNLDELREHLAEGFALARAENALETGFMSDAAD